ncbi:MAG: PSD1 and planctomycete cytochrome C domain-containing protein [Planctomycetaceae bacterium]
MPRACLSLLCLWLCVAPLSADEPASRKTKAAAPQFESQVRPILKAHCFPCHGEEQKHEAKLDLRLARLIAKGGESGPAIVVGHHAESLLWKRVTANEMPPGEKKLSEKERRIIAEWIDAGAKTARPEPEAIADDDVTEEERSFWSFQPIRRPAVPRVGVSISSRDRQGVLADHKLGPLPNGRGSDLLHSRVDSVRTPVDAFVLARLEQDGLSFSDEADRATLVRRATFDLLGLPPTPDEVDEFLADREPGAYERLIDRLLESSHYGERWARHWLDVAGYADSDGFGEKDLERKYAYKYRDWLIRAINADRPWDEMIREQLAGDELLLALTTPSESKAALKGKGPLQYRGLTEQQAEMLIATGFLRLGPDGTGDAAVNQETARNECIAETIKIVSTSLLGLTVGCAQCHSHRYDPISHVDYHRIRAIFEPALNWKDWRTPNARLVSLRTAEQNEVVAKCDLEIKRLEQERTDKIEELAANFREKNMEGLPDELKEKIREAYKTPLAKRTNEQKQLLADHPKAAVGVNLIDRNLKDEHKAIMDQFGKLIASQRAIRPADDFAHCLTEIPGTIPPTHLFFRGEITQPKQEVAPGELAVLCSENAARIPVDDPSLPTSGRRLAYARHLTNGQHPLVARVFVNRVWMHHFGRGLVATPGDFGRLGEPPSHPELLDWLSDEFMRSGWSLKQLHRLLMTSSVYRQASRRRTELDAVDPDNRLLGRMSIRRLEAETVRDAMLAVSGELTAKLFGSPIPVTPDETGQIIVGVDTRDGAGRPTGKKVPLFGEEFRRSVYITVRRTMPLAMLETFDAATLSPNCAIRTPSTVAPQSLMLMNNDFASDQSEALAAQVAREAGSVPAAQVRLAWRLTLGRDPSEAQIQSAITFLTEHAEQFAAQPTDKKNPVTPTQRALASFCQALLISNSFLYVD